MFLHIAFSPCALREWDTSRIMSSRIGHAYRGKLEKAGVSSRVAVSDTASRRVQVLYSCIYVLVYGTCSTFYSLLANVLAALI